MVVPDYPFIKASSPVVQQWEGLHFAVEKVLASTCHHRKVDDANKLRQPDRTADVRETLVDHLRKFFNAGDSVTLPGDPSVREYYLGVLHTMILASPEATTEFSLKLLMMVSPNSPHLSLLHLLLGCRSRNYPHSFTVVI